MTSNNGRRGEAPDPEVVPVAKRRHFSAKEKLRILEEADRCEYGEIGALVRREGIYTSYLSRWRRERERGQLEALSPKKPGPESAAEEGQAERVEQLQRENEQLAEQLRQAKMIIDVQKKVSDLLGLTDVGKRTTEDG